MTTGVFRGKINVIPLHSPSRKIGVSEKQRAIIFCGSRVIVNFVPKFVARVTGVGRGEI